MVVRTKGKYFGIVPDRLPMSFFECAFLFRRTLQGFWGCISSLFWRHDSRWLRGARSPNKNLHFVSLISLHRCDSRESFFPSCGICSGYEDSLKSLQRRERANEVSRGGHDTSSVVGRRANLAAKRRQRFHSFSNGETVYTHEMTLQREQHCCAGTEKRRKAEHRRAHSEAENNITETVIHEHPGTEISLASSLPNTSSTLHGRWTSLVEQEDVADRGRSRYNFRCARFSIPHTLVHPPPRFIILPSRLCQSCVVSSAFPSTGVLWK